MKTTFAKRLYWLLTTTGSFMGLVLGALWCSNRGEIFGTVAGIGLSATYFAVIMLVVKEARRK